ncbi:MAG: addiction module protein [Desulfamplus sp.]|nr:addiction module protein [Desulfamplus sp.]
MEIVDIESMSTLERIQTMELLWNSLSDQKEKVDSPSWHYEILQKRKERIESGKTKFLTLEELKKSCKR